MEATDGRTWRRQRTIQVDIKLATVAISLPLSPSLLVSLSLSLSVSPTHLAPLLPNYRMPHATNCCNFVHWVRLRCRYENLFAINMRSDSSCHMLPAARSGRGAAEATNALRQLVIALSPTPTRPPLSLLLPPLWLFLLNVSLASPFVDSQMSPAASGNLQLATGKLAAASSRRINIFILPARFSIFPIENFRQKIKAKNKIQQFIQHFLRNLWLVFLARVDVYFAYFGRICWGFSGGHE